MPNHCKASYNIAVERGYDVSMVAGERVVAFDGRQVSLTPRGWKARHSRDPSWSLWFHSMVWLVPLALEDPDTAVAVMVERDKALPDPGTGADKSTRQSTGWTQGQARTRLQTVTCLYSLTGAPELVRIAERLAAANLDPKRYPGPPHRPVHNHGTMSNIALVMASEEFDRPEWAEAAVARFRRDLPYVFDRCGMMREQSSTYQEHNVSLWDRAARLLDVDLRVQRDALGALVRPDGVLEAIGDGQPMTHVPPNGKELWCPGPGWAAATREGMHYVLRFGPSVDYHGHLDHGAATWFTQGVAVLSDRGLYGKERDARFTYARGMSAHSVFEPIGAPSYDPDTRAVRLGIDRFEMTDEQGGISRTRTITIGDTSLTVDDRGKGARSWIQHWQLAPGWTPTADGAVHEEAGLALTVDCSSLRPVKVESFVARRTAVMAWDLQCLVKGKAGSDEVRQRTTLTVGPAT
jgi:hypothetical protein